MTQLCRYVMALAPPRGNTGENTYSLQNARVSTPA
jgi:hypothetical protein